MQHSSLERTFAHFCACLQELLQWRAPGTSFMKLRVSRHQSQTRSLPLFVTSTITYSVIRPYLPQLVKLLSIKQLNITTKRWLAIHGSESRCAFSPNIRVRKCKKPFALLALVCTFSHYHSIATRFFTAISLTHEGVVSSK